MDDAEGADEADQGGEAIGRVLAGRWRVVRFLGRGGMSNVYEARDDGGESVAVKIPHRVVAQHPRARARFVREASLANLVGHPDAVKVVGSGADADDTLFLVMELLAGETLRDRRLNAGGRLGAAEVLHVADRVLDVLAAAHAKAIVHRDIKPENVFLTTAGGVKVLDFGIAAVRDEAREDAQLTQSGVSLGTPAFMAPEQARGRNSSVDARTDIWSLGATMFFCLSGRHVHEEASTPNEALIFSATQRAPALRTVCPGVPVDVARIVDRALALDPAGRWQSAREMREAVQDASRPSRSMRVAGAVEPTGDATQDDEPVPSGTRGPPRTKWLLLALAAGVAVTARLVMPAHVVRPDRESLSPVASGAPILVAEALAPSAPVPAAPAPSVEGPSSAVLAASTAHAPLTSRAAPRPAVAAAAPAATAIVPVAAAIAPIAAAVVPVASAQPSPSDTISDSVLDRRK